MDGSLLTSAIAGMRPSGRRRLRDPAQQAPRLAVYTFYLCSSDGAATSFEAFDLGGDEHAHERALRMLGEHPSCSYVAVWEGDRPLMEQRREAAVGRCLDRPVGVAANQN